MNISLIREENALIKKFAKEERKVMRLHVGAKTKWLGLELNIKK
jgi:hypothetical protein